MAEPHETLDVTNGDEDDGVYDPSMVEANLNIEHGGGVGARDLARQREPTEVVTPDDEDDGPTEGLGRAHPKE